MQTRHAWIGLDFRFQSNIESPEAKEIPRDSTRSIQNFHVESTKTVWCELVIAMNERCNALRSIINHSSIHRHFHGVAKALCRAFPHFVRLPSASTPVSLKISHDRLFWPYFEHCVGAIDGTHVPVRVSQQHAAYRDRKGNLSINVFVACDFQMRFVYALSGWEGSAHDARLYDDALNKGFDVPIGKYFLGDAGFALSHKCLVPYRGVRYHLREYAGRGNEPRTREELFNLRHAQLRSVIERTIGVWRGRFRILRNCATLAPNVVTRVVYATIVLHNWIRAHCSEEDFVDIDQDVDRDDDDDNNPAPVVTVPRDVENWRDAIAQEMWDDYVADRPNSI